LTCSLPTANIGRDAVDTADGGVPQFVRVIARRADEITGFGRPGASLFCQRKRLIASWNAFAMLSHAASYPL
jgi:hypothetical protein